MNFPGVVIPLASAPAPNNYGSTDEKKTNFDDNHSLDKAASDSEKGVGSRPDDAYASPLTLETLRAEIETDMAKSGTDSAYDRMFSLTRTA